MGRQPLRQPADLVIGQETLASLPAVPPDAAAGVGPLGPKAHPFRLRMTTDSTGMDLSAAAGVARSEANQFRTSRASMSATGRPEKCGSSWLRR